VYSDVNIPSPMVVIYRDKPFCL